MMKFLASLALVGVLAAGGAFAQTMNPPGVVSTAPTPSAPSGVTTNQGAGAAGAAASPGVPTASSGAPNPQSGNQGQQPSSQSGGSPGASN